MTKLSFAKKSNIKEKIVHENELWAEDVNEIMDAIESFDQSISNFQNFNKPLTLADAWPIGGMQVRAYGTNCPILDQYYTGAPATVTLNPADANWPRKDAIVLDIQGNISAIQGTADSLIVAEPFVDPTLYYLIRYLLIPKNATSPVDPSTGNAVVVTSAVYKENLGEAGSESNASGSNASINVASAASIIGDVSIEATNPQKNHKILFDYTTVKTTTGSTHFKYVLKLKAAVATDKYWFFGLLKDGKRIGNSWFLFKHGQYGFNALDLNEQILSITLEATLFKNQDYNGIELFFYHGNLTIPGYFVDDVEFIDGLSINPNIPSDTIYSEDVVVNTTNFNNNLSPLDTDVQKALETLDNVISGSPAVNEIIEKGFNHIINFDWYVFAQLYRFNGILTNNLVTDTITLDPAPATVDFKRFDIVVFNDDFTFSVIKGTEGLSPAIPYNLMDFSTQIELTVILVEYGTTTPTYLTKDLMYDEGVGTPTEFNVTTAGTGVTLNSLQSNLQVVQNLLKFLCQMQQHGFL